MVLISSATILPTGIPVHPETTSAIAWRVDADLHQRITPLELIELVVQHLELSGQVSRGSAGVSSGGVCCGGVAELCPDRRVLPLLSAAGLATGQGSMTERR